MTNVTQSSPEEDAAIQIEESTINRSEAKKLLRIHIDYKLEFDTQYTLKNNKLYGAF